MAKTKKSNTGSNSGSNSGITYEQLLKMKVADREKVLASMTVSDLLALIPEGVLDKRFLKLLVTVAQENDQRFANQLNAAREEKTSSVALLEQIQQMLEDAERNLDDVVADNEELAKQNQELRDQILILKAEIEFLTAQQQSYEQVTAMGASALKNMTGAEGEEELFERLVVMYDQIDAATAALDVNIRHANRNPKRNNRKHEAGKSINDEYITNLQGRISDLRSENGKLQSELAVVKGKYAKLMKDVDEVINENAFLEAENAALRVGLEANEQYADETVHRWERENEGLRGTLKGTQRENAELRAAYVEANGRNQALETENAGLSRQVDESRRDTKRRLTRAGVASTAAIVFVATAVGVGLGVALSNSNNENAELSATNQNLQTENVGQGQTIKEQGETINKQNKDIAAKDQTIASQGQTIKDQNKVIDSQNKEIAGQGQTIDDLNKELDALKNPTTPAQTANSAGSATSKPNTNGGSADMIKLEPKVENGNVVNEWVNANSELVVKGEVSDANTGALLVSYNYSYDDNQNIETSVVKDMRDGSTRIEKFEDGKLALSTTTKADGQIVTETYTNGVIDQKETIESDGTIVKETYEGGMIVSQTTTYEDGTQYTTIYTYEEVEDEDGNVLVSQTGSTYNEDGELVSTTNPEYFEKDQSNDASLTTSAQEVEEEQVAEKGSEGVSTGTHKGSSSGRTRSSR